MFKIMEYTKISDTIAEKTIETKQRISLEDLDNQIEMLTSRIADMQKELANVEAEKAEIIKLGIKEVTPIAEVIK